MTNGVNLTGDTCTAANELGTLCIFSQSPGNDIVYSLAPHNFIVTSINLTNATAGWNAALVALDGACNGNSVCLRNADSGGPGENETMDMSGLTAYPYFVIVTSSTSDTTCGQFQVVLNGFSTPVQLQSFEVI